MSTPNWPSIVGTPAEAVDNALASVELAAQTNPAGARVEAVNLVAAFDAKPSSARTLIIKKTPSDTVIFSTVITEAGPAPIDVTGFMGGPGDGLTAELQASGTAGTKSYLSFTGRVV